MVLGHDISKGPRTQDIEITKDVSFESILLGQKTLKGLKSAGFHKPSPIQLYAIPVGKCGFDLVIEAKSGTGKTAVFTVLALEKIERNKGVQAIILAPTREIAFQIYDVITQIGAYYKGLKVAVVIGGMPVQEDKDKFQKNVHIVVGSPGRMCHLIHDKAFDLQSVKLLVLDEADKLLEKSFLTDINYIYSNLPSYKQVIMCSATYSDETRSIIKNYVRKAQHICPDSNSVLLGIYQKVTIIACNSNIHMQTKQRYKELIRILSQKQFKQCLIFCNFQVRVLELHRMLTRDKWPAEQLYGQQEQTDRLDALKTLQEYKCRILISTDLAARGIDASNVDLVINFEPPSDWQNYLHRIGRAGRFGSYGTAVTILCVGKEVTKFKGMLKKTNISFNLEHYWSSELFSLTDLEEQQENDNSPEQKCDFWKSLTMEPIEDKTSNDDLTLPNIKQLNSSTNECNNTQIESFSDILTSFHENHDDRDIELTKSKYKQFQINKLTMPMISNAITLKDSLDHNIAQPQFSINTNLKNDSGLCNGHHNFTESDEIKLKIHVNGMGETVNSNDEKHINEKLSSINVREKQNAPEIKMNNVTGNVKSDEYGIQYEIHNELNVTEQALLNSGLPIAFGKTRKNKKKHGKRNNVAIIDKTSIHQQNNIIPHKYFTTKQCNIKQEIKGESCGSIDNHSSRYESNAETDFSSKIYSDHDDSERKRFQQGYDNFDNWYNQLRYQKQYLLQVLYYENLVNILK